MKKLKEEKYVIAVDGGGAKTTAVLADVKGNILAFYKAGSSHPRHLGLKKAMDNVALAISEVLKSCKNGEIAAAFLGLPATEEEFKFKKHLIKKELLKHKEISAIFRKKTIINSDQLVGFRSGTDIKDGLVLIAGSGCAIHGWRGKKESKVCGWGYLSEMGSSFFVGQKTLRAIFKSLDGRAEKTLLTRLIFNYLKIKTKEDLIFLVYSKQPTEILPNFSILCDKAARLGDKTAKDILIESGKELALSVKTAIKQLGFQKKEFPLVLIGSLLNSEVILKTVKKEVKKFVPRVQFIRPKVEPVIGGIKLAIEEVEKDESIKNKRR